MRLPTDASADSLARRGRRGACAAGLVLALSLTSAAYAGDAGVEQDEHRLWQLWQAHEAQPGDHEGLLELCARIEARDPGFRFIEVVRGIAAWHLMKAGRPDEARAAWAGLDRSAPGEPFARAAQRMARTWLTRMDRETLRKALQTAYRRDLQYPESLERLADAAETELPMRDRWGDPWTYEWTRFRFLRVSPGQRYSLESRNVRGSSDLSEALRSEYGSGINLRPVRLVGTGAAPSVAFQAEGAPAEQTVLAAGASLRGQTFVYIGRRILVLADADHWRVFMKPRQ